MESTLREILTGKSKEIYSIPLDATVHDAVRAMVDGGVGSVLVMNEDRLEGLFTERDLMRRVAYAGLDPVKTPVRDAMTTEIATVSPDLQIGEAMSLCTERRLRHLPVYEDEKLVGIVSLGDLTKAAVKDQQHTIEDLIKYIYGGEPV